jgi:hypothetical protein
MGAYLGWRLKKEGFHSLASFMAPHLAGVLYEFAITAMGKDQEHIYFGPFRNLYSVNTQLNIAFNDIGARYGVDKGQPWSFTGYTRNSNVNKAFTALLTFAQPMPKLTDEELNKKWGDQTERFKLFYRVIAPDAYVIPAVLGVSGKLGIDSTFFQ